MLIECWDIKTYPSVSSTQHVAKELINCGNARTCTLIVGLHQSQGYGSRGSEWVSPRGNLYCSAIIPPSVISPTDELSDSVARLYNFIAAIAIGEALYSLYPVLLPKIRYKWVNDVLCDGRKIAGILIEKWNNHLLIGIGVNIKSSPVLSSSSSAYQHATSMRQELAASTGIASRSQPLLLPSRSKLARCIIGNIGIYHNTFISYGFGKIRSVWLQKAYLLGQKISVNLSVEERLEGELIGLNDHGQLLLRNPRTETINAISHGRIMLSNADS